VAAAEALAPVPDRPSTATDAARWASLRRMKRIERIVVGIDLEDGRVGPTAQLAITQARAFAETHGARITLLHSTNADPSEDDGAASNGADPILESTASSLRTAGMACDVVLTDEPAGLAIVRCASRLGADLAIVGKRLGDDEEARRMGYVSSEVVRHCPSLVSVVKPGSVPKPRLIVAATDGGPVGTQVVTAAAMVATLFDSALHAIHAIQIDMEVQMERDEVERAFVDRRRSEIRSTIVREASAAGFTGEVHVHAGVTTPAGAVIEAVERLHPDLVVMGTVSREGIPGLLVGNTAERLLDTLDCSLLVAKPKDFVCPVQLD
jgi:universal stress protein E